MVEGPKPERTECLAKNMVKRTSLWAWLFMFVVPLVSRTDALHASPINDPGSFSASLPTDLIRPDGTSLVFLRNTTENIAAPLPTFWSVEVRGQKRWRQIGYIEFGKSGPLQPLTGRLTSNPIYKKLDPGELRSLPIGIKGMKLKDGQMVRISAKPSFGQATMEPSQLVLRVDSRIPEFSNPQSWSGSCNDHARGRLEVMNGGLAWTKVQDEFVPSTSKCEALAPNAYRILGSQNDVVGYFLVV
jgi:hypothetical protein